MRLQNNFSLTFTSVPAPGKRSACSWLMKTSSHSMEAQALSHGSSSLAAAMYPAGQHCGMCTPKAETPLEPFSIENRHIKLLYGILHRLSTPTSPHLLHILAVFSLQFRPKASLIGTHILLLCPGKTPLLQIPSYQVQLAWATQSLLASLLWVLTHGTCVGATQGGRWLDDSMIDFMILSAPALVVGSTILVS